MGIARKSLIDYFAQNAALVVSFVAGILLSKYFGKGGRGAYVLVLFANAMLVNLTNMGVEISARVLAGRKSSSVSQVHTAAVMLVMAISILSGILLYFFRAPLCRLFFKDVPPNLLFLAALMLPISLYELAWQGIMVGLGEITVYARLTMWNRIAQSAPVIILIAFTFPKMSWLIYAWVIIQIATLIVSLALMGRRHRLFAPFDLALIKEMLSFGWVVYIGNMASSLLQRYDWIVITSIVGNEGIGVYSQASTFSDKVTLIGGSLERATYEPAINADKNYAPLLIRKVFRYNLYVNILGAILMYAFGSACIRLFLWEQFMGSLFPLKFLLISVIFMSCSRILAIYFTAHLKKPSIPGIINWIVLPISIGLCYLLTKKWGINGASVAVATIYFIHASIFFGVFLAKNPTIGLGGFFLPEPGDIDYLKKKFLRR